MRLLLIRHGQTPSNVAGALDTAYPGAELTRLGRAQAAAIPGALADEDIAGVYASPLIRTQLTAAPLADARRLGVEVLSGLEEIAAGALEMDTAEESIRAYMASIGSWAHGDLEHPMPGGHTGRAFLDRYDAALREIAGRHRASDTVAAVSHGAAIRLFCTLRAHNTTPDHVSEHRLANTGLAVMEGDPDAGWELVSWHDEPLGGEGLLDVTAHDVTGDAPEELDEPADRPADPR